MKTLTRWVVVTVLWAAMAFSLKYRERPMAALCSTFSKPATKILDFPNCH